MAQLYQIHMGGDVQVVQVSSEDVGQLVQLDDSLLLNEGQVVYQTISPSAYQQQAASATHYIINDDQQQQQQHHQQQQHNATQPTVHTDQTVQSQAQQQQQTRQVYQTDQSMQQIVQQMQQTEQQQQHIQQQSSNQSGQAGTTVYYTTTADNQLLQVTHQQQPQQQQTASGYQQAQATQQVQQQHQQPQEHQQPQQQRLSTATSTAPPIIYRMQTGQQQQTGQLNHVIVQGGQPVLIQHAPDTTHRLIYQQNRLLYAQPPGNATSTAAAQQQQQQHDNTQVEQLHIQQQQQQPQPVTTTTRLISARLNNITTTTIPYQQQNPQPNIIYQTLRHTLPIQQQQQQQQQQLPPNAYYRTGGGVAAGNTPKFVRAPQQTTTVSGSPKRLIRQQNATNVAGVRTTQSIRHIIPGMRTPRPPRCATILNTNVKPQQQQHMQQQLRAPIASASASAAAATGAGATGVTIRSPARVSGTNMTLNSLIATRGAATISANATPSLMDDGSTKTILHLQQHQQMQLLQQNKTNTTAATTIATTIATTTTANTAITTQGPVLNKFYRLESGATAILQQPLHQQPQQQSSQLQQTSKNNYDLDLDESIQAVVVKKEHQQQEQQQQQHQQQVVITPTNSTSVAATATWTTMMTSTASTNTTVSAAAAFAAGATTTTTKVIPYYIAKYGGQKLTNVVATTPTANITITNRTVAAPTTITTTTTAAPHQQQQQQQQHHIIDDDDNRMVRMPNGNSVSLAEFKKRQANINISFHNTNNATITTTSSSSTVAVAGANGNSMRYGASINAIRPTTPLQQQSSNVVGGGGGNITKYKQVRQQQNKTNTIPITTTTQYAVASTVTTNSTTATTTTTTVVRTKSAVHQTAHNNYEIQSSHVLQNRNNQQMPEKDRNSAKMLVISALGEQRLITFTLPRESCTVQDLLEQVDVPFDNSTTIQCVELPGANIDFVVTVGFATRESHSELISRAEQIMQSSRSDNHSNNNNNNNNSNKNSAANNTNSAYAAEEAAQKTAAVSNSSVAVGVAARPRVPDSIAPKRMQGYFAVCKRCGFSGLDHARCERCRIVFEEPPKRVPYPTKSNNNNAASDSKSNTNATTNANNNASLSEKKKYDFKSIKSAIAALNVAGSDSVGGSTTLRTARNSAGRARVARPTRRIDVEPITLTISSDDDENDDEHLNKTAINIMENVTTTSIKTTAMEFEPPETSVEQENEFYSDFERSDITELTDLDEKLFAEVTAKVVYIGNYRFEPEHVITFTSKGMRILAPMQTDSTTVTLNLHKREIVKIIANFSHTSQSFICLYILKPCGVYIKNALKLKEPTTDKSDGFALYDNLNLRKIILQIQNITESACHVIKSIWDCFEEITSKDANKIMHALTLNDAPKESNNSNAEKKNNSTTVSRTSSASEIRQILTYRHKKGHALTISTGDYACLATDQYLNDIIIDFYLMWLHDNLSAEQREKTHIFSTFFYKRLTTMTRHNSQKDKDKNLTAAEKRHARVQNWTKNVNIFEKDFIVIPINEQSHWFLAIICFPKLKGPVTFDDEIPVDPQDLIKQQQPKSKRTTSNVSLQIGSTTITPLTRGNTTERNTSYQTTVISDDNSERDEAEGDDSDILSDCSDNSSQLNPSLIILSSSSSNTVIGSTTTTDSATPATATTTTSVTTTTTAEATKAIKQPVILIFDSLAGASRSRVVATLRDYLTCEYRAKMSPEKYVFTKTNMPGHCLKVPQQNNFTDCGVFLLQYVEQFFNVPITDYRLPIKQLSCWFDTFTVTRKREDIALLLQNLVNEQKKRNPLMNAKLPEISFPTLNGELLEPTADSNENEFDDEDEEDEEFADEDELYLSEEVKKRKRKIKDEELDESYGKKVKSVKEKRKVADKDGASSSRSKLNK